MDRRYIIKPDIIGAAARMHGYVALLGLGITLIRNQAVDIIPTRIKLILTGNLERFNHD
jgi:hypothetical protein